MVQMAIFLGVFGDINLRSTRKWSTPTQHESIQISPTVRRVLWPGRPVRTGRYSSLQYLYDPGERQEFEGLPLTIVITSKDLVDSGDKASGFVETRIVVMHESVSNRLGADPARLGASLSRTSGQRPTNIPSLLQQSQAMPQLAFSLQLPRILVPAPPTADAFVRSAHAKWISNAVPQRH